jgi:hypothetical protein
MVGARYRDLDASGVQPGTGVAKMPDSVAGKCGGARGRAFSC